MQHGKRWIAATLVLPALALSACGNSSFDNEAATDEGPARVEPIKGSDVSRVILTPAAARRIGIETAPAQEIDGRNGTRRRTIPYTALLYDAEGRPFTYTSPSRLTYVRQGITVQSIRHGVVLLRRGPSPGTPVVTVGAAELLGTEYGVEE